MKKSSAIVYLVIIILGIISFVLGCIFSQIFIHKIFESEEVHTEEYTVSANETLWDIACEYSKGDVREYVYNLRKLNNIDDCIIYEGQRIKIIK